MKNEKESLTQKSFTQLNNDYDSEKSNLKAWKLQGNVKANLIENYENEE